MNHVGDGANLVNGVNHVDGFWGIGHADADVFALFGADGF